MLRRLVPKILRNERVCAGHLLISGMAGSHQSSSVLLSLFLTNKTTSFVPSRLGK